MKLALVSPGARRQERRDQLRDDRTAAPTLRAAFPTLRHLRLELEFDGSAPSTPAQQSHILHPPARAFFEFPCPYADCDGRFDLTGGVNAALANATHRAEGALECSGSRARHIGSKQPCLLRLIYTVTATFQPDT
jgi:hypothetical protein